MTVPPRMTTPRYPGLAPTQPASKPPDFNNRPRIRRQAPWRPIVLTILAGIVTACCIFFGIRQMFPNELVKIPVPFSGNHAVITLRPSAPGEKIILVMGVDHAQPAKHEDYSFEGARTDTMMLARISTRNNSLSLVSIPRDSKVYLANGRGVDKINAAHAIGGPELAVSTVEESLGVPVDNYVVINFQGVKELVDTLGGVDVYVEKRMRYRDNTAKLNISFDPGQYHLNGQAAEEFLRFRHDELGDIGRIRRQQQFVNAVTKKLREPAVFSKIPQLVQIGSKYVKTDMDFGEMVRLAAFVPEIRFEKMRTATLPGHPSGGAISYWLIDPQAAQAVLDRMILDNGGASSGNDAEQGKPLRVGIFYDPAYAGQLPDLVQGLEKAQFNVVCKQAYRKAGTQIIEHSTRVTTDTTHAVELASPALARARLIFAPVGTTYETTACSAREDYTIIIGADALAHR